MTRATWRDLTERHLAIGAPRKVLLVEDDDLYVEQVRQTLLNAHPTGFSLEVARTLAAAERTLRAGTFDVILLDLGLPDEHGLRSFERVQHEANDRPIVVLTSADDPEQAARLLYLGAHDYLIKGASEDLLMHVIGRAIGRTAPEAGRLPVIPRDTDAETPLEERDDELFEKIVEAYLALVAAAVERHIVGADPDGYRGKLIVLAETLARAECGARDALVVHAAAVRRMVHRGAPDLDAWVAESRLVALELMGRLTDHYRRRSISR